MFKMLLLFRDLYEFLSLFFKTLVILRIYGLKDSYGKIKQRKFFFWEILGITLGKLVVSAFSKKESSAVFFGIYAKFSRIYSFFTS